MYVERQIRQYLSAIQYVGDVYPHGPEPIYQWHNDDGILRLHVFIGDIQVSTIFVVSDWDELSKYLAFFPDTTTSIRGTFKPR